MPASVPLEEWSKHLPRGPEPGHRVVLPVTSISVTNVERLKRILKEAVSRFNNEMLDDEERQLLLARIKRLRKALNS
jgi:hypothetical protein